VELSDAGFVLPDLDVALWSDDEESEQFEQVSIGARGYFSNQIRVTRALADGVCHTPVPPGPGQETRGWTFGGIDELDDAQLRRLLNNLDEVPLRGMTLLLPLTDGQLAMLGTTASIAGLSQTSTKVTAAGLAHLASLPSLKDLSLTSIKLTADGMRQIGRCEGLLSLGLNDPGVKDADLAPISRLTSLRILDISGAKKLTGKCAAVFEPLVNLECLSLFETKIDDRVCDVLAVLPALRQVVLYDSLVTDRGVRRLAELKRLQFLNVSGGRVSDAARDAVRTRTGAVVV
jgi:hypothetical protein